MRVAVIGSGGVGGFVGGRLARAGHEVAFLARGEHLHALREHGLRVRSTEGDFEMPSVTATDRIEELGPADLYLFTVKAYDTDTVARALQPNVRPGATVLTLQNGIDNHERIDGIVGAGTALAGTIRIETSIAEPGVIAHTSQGHAIHIGEVGADGPSSERVERLLAAFKEAGLNARLAREMRTALWDKFLFLVPFAALSTLARAPIGEILAQPELTETMEALLAEIAAIASAEGIDVGADAIEKRMGFMRQLHPEFKSSMQRDLERGKRLEVDALTGTVVRLGARHAIPTPVHACINAVLTLEDRRAQAAASASRRT